MPTQKLLVAPTSQSLMIAMLGNFNLSCFAVLAARSRYMFNCNNTIVHVRPSCLKSAVVDKRSHAKLNISKKINIFLAI
jgi:hypothetical protein